MEAKISCNSYGCNNECDEHAYCDSHFQKLMDEEFEKGKKEGYEEARKEYENV